MKYKSVFQFMIPFLTAGLFCIQASAHAPVGLELIRITHNLSFDANPRINNKGQIVFSSRLGAPYELNTSEIFLYDHGTVVQITNDDFMDGFPDINDQGQIIWAKQNGPKDANGDTSFEIFLWDKGVTTQLTNDSVTDFLPKINNQGHAVWCRSTYKGCAKQNADIVFYNGSTIVPICDEGYNQFPELNDHDEIVWTQYFYCGSPSSSAIMMYSGGKVTYLLSQPGITLPSLPSINNHGQVAWGGVGGISLWDKKQGSVAMTLTDSGHNVHLNDKGDLIFNRWDDTDEAWHLWLYSNGVFTQLTYGRHWGFLGDINNSGEIAFEFGEFPTGDIHAFLKETVSSPASTATH